MRLHFIFLSFIVLIFAGSCKKKESVLSSITKPWALQESSGSAFSKNDSLIVTKSNFTTIINGTRASGAWKILPDSSLILTYDLKPLATGVDSVSYKVIDLEPVVLFFKNNKEIARVSGQGATAEHLTRTFDVKLCNDNQLTLAEGEKQYSLAYSVKYKESSISFKAILRGMIGILFLSGILYLLSSNKKAISWKLVVGGILFQIVFAILVLKVPFVERMFEYMSNFFVEVLEFTKAGATFVFGNMMDTSTYGFIFAFQILPTILFFSALTSIFYYLGVLQKIVYGLSWLMGKVMKLSGAENLSTSANIFLGQTEAPLLIKPFLAKMNRSEMLCIMVGGMANTAGGVLAAYVGFLGGDDPVQQMFFAKHLLAASIMSAPATIVVSKMMIPQTEPIDEKLELSKEKLGSNLLEAISVGTTDGLKLAVNVAAMLIVFIALTFMANRILTTVGSWTNLNSWIASISGGQYKELSLQVIFAYPCSIITYAMGVCKEDMLLVGQLLGEKTVINEFNAYITLGGMKAQNLFTEQKSVIMATYILSGFANFASIGIQIGGIGALAPNKRGMLSELGMKALIGGTIASLFTATIVGMLI